MKAREFCSCAYPLKKSRLKFLWPFSMGWPYSPIHLCIKIEPELFTKKNIGIACLLVSPVGGGMASPQAFSLRGFSAQLSQGDTTLTLDSAPGESAWVQNGSPD